MAQNIFYYLRDTYRENGKKLSVRKFAEKINIAYSHVSELENGALPSLNQLKAYHQFFNVPYEYLLGEIDNYDNLDLRTNIVQTVDYMNNSSDETDQKISDVVNRLLSTDKGYTLLFYLADYMNKESCTKEDQDKLIKQIDIVKKCSSKLGYSELRISVDNQIRHSLIPTGKPVGLSDNPE